MNKLAVCWAFLLGLPSCSWDKPETTGPAVPVVTTPPVPLLDSTSLTVLLAFIRHDSLALSYHSSRSKAISCRALELHIDPPPTHALTVDELLAPREGFHVGVQQLLTYNRQGKRFFTKQDSLFLLQQAQQQRERALAPTWFAPADLLLPEPQEPQRQAKRQRGRVLLGEKGRSLAGSGIHCWLD